MRQVEGFTILEGDEIPPCDHERERIYTLVCINPNGEYVQGYGYAPVFSSKVTGEKCVKCGCETDNVEEIFLLCPVCGEKGLPSAIPELAMCTGCANKEMERRRDFAEIDLTRLTLPEPWLKTALRRLKMKVGI